jgi:haloalkane dehalogenase
MAHTLVENGGHFIQEDQGAMLAKLLIQFINQTQLK